MRRFGIAALACLCASAALADFTTRRPPPAGDCGALAGDVAGSLWYGAYSGGLKSDINDKHYRVFLDGCFPSEASCRVWLQQAITYAVGPTSWMRCTPYG